MKSLSRHILDHYNTRLPKLTFDGNLAIWDGSRTFGKNTESAIKFLDIAPSLTRFKRECDGEDRYRYRCIGRWLWWSMLNYTHVNGGNKCFKSVTLKRRQLTLNWNDKFTDPAKKELIFQMASRGWVIINRWFIDHENASTMELWDEVADHMRSLRRGKPMTIDILRPVLEGTRERRLSIIRGQALRASDIYNDWDGFGEELYMSYVDRQAPVVREGGSCVFHLDRQDEAWTLRTELGKNHPSISDAIGKDICDIFTTEIKWTFETAELAKLTHLEISYDEGGKAFTIKFSTAADTPFGGVGSMMALFCLYRSTISRFTY